MVSWVKSEDSYRFKSKHDLKKIIKRVFRSDSGRRANMYTKFNKIILPVYSDNDNICGFSRSIYLPAALDERYALSKKYIKGIFDCGATFDKIILERFESTDVKAFSFESDVLKTLYEFLMDYDKTTGDKQKLLFAVTHEDRNQNPLHFHIFLYDRC